MLLLQLFQRVKLFLMALYIYPPAGPPSAPFRLVLRNPVPADLRLRIGIVAAGRAVALAVPGVSTTCGIPDVLLGLSINSPLIYAVAVIACVANAKDESPRIVATIRGRRGRDGVAGISNHSCSHETESKGEELHRNCIMRLQKGILDLGCSGE